MWLAFWLGLWLPPDSGPVSLPGDTQHTGTQSVKSFTSELLRSRNKPPFFRPIPTEIQPPPPHLTWRTINNMYLHRHQRLSTKGGTISAPAPLQKEAFPHTSSGDPPTSRLSSVKLCFQFPTLSHGVFLLIVHCLLCVCVSDSYSSPEA